MASCTTPTRPTSAGSTPSGACTRGSTARHSAATRPASGGAATTSTTASDGIQGHASEAICAAEVIMPTDEESLTSNQNVIEEFRANSGVVSQLGFPVLLLTTTGARTGRRTTTPLGYSNDRDCVFVVASKGGAPTSPTWFHNLRANPSVTS